MAENLTGMIHKDLHKYLTGMHEVDERLPECQDVEEKWEQIAQSYLPDGIREFTAYPTTSLGWMMCFPCEQRTPSPEHRTRN